MRTELYWIPEAWPGRIAIMPRPRGGDWLEDEMRAWRNAGVDLVVSLLEPEEFRALDLASEEKLARANRMEFVSFPIADRGIPEAHDTVSELMTKLVASLRAGKNVAVHCRQGIGRAGLIAASLLIRLGVDPEKAIEGIGTGRGLPVPETAEQRQWIADFARSSLKLLPT